MTHRYSLRRVALLLALPAAAFLLAACTAPAKSRPAATPAPATVVNADLASQFGVALAGTAAELQREGRRLFIVLPAQLLFATDTATVAPQASASLAPMLALLAKQHGLRVTLRAHTDSIGSQAFNEEFARQRAAAARLWLMEHGVPEATIAAHGVGENSPVADNATPAGRERNRRVELILEPAPHRS